MTRNIIFTLTCCTPILVTATTAIADTKVTALNMDLGHWVTTADSSAMIEQMLASMPEENRAMIRQIMEEKMQDTSTTDQCITAEILDNFDEQLKSSLGDAEDCEFNVTESTSEKFIGSLNCPESVMQITTNVINSKRNESMVTTNVTGMSEQKITTVSEWKSSDCPAGI